MLKALLPLLLCLALLAPVVDPAVTAALQSGQLLRMHVIAQDDTSAMQAVKYPVRDAVRSCYAKAADPAQTMLQNTGRLLTELSDAAQAAARAAGFDGAVEVLLGTATFDSRTLDGLCVPAGDYPTLIIRLGEGRGHNWWGLVDPERSLLAASIQLGEGVEWDWSLRGFWQALIRSFTFWRGGDAQ